jgi:hypothetical protein
MDLTTNAVSTILTTNHGNCDGIARDAAGDFYISTWSGQNVVKYNNAFSEGPTVVATGLSNPADIFFNTTDLVLGIPNSGNNTVTFVSFSSAHINENQLSDITVFPNPTRDQLIINFSKVSTPIEQIEIYDVSGKSVYLQKITFSEGNDNLVLDVSQYQAGVYFLNVQGIESLQIIRFVVE